MHCSLFFGITLLASLFSNVLALGTLYRADDRDPASLKAQGGITAFRTSGDCGSNLLKSHSDKDLGTNDPFVSTSEDMEISKGFDKKYHYIIDSSKITGTKYDVNDYVPDGYIEELEIAVCFTVPWSAVISVQEKKGPRNYQPIAMPKKRSAFAHDARAARARAEVVV
jgi:hypothetical protein